MLTKFKNGVKKFHKDEKGLEALQVILIVAIAAIILALLKAFWPDVKNFFKRSIEFIMGQGGNAGDGKGDWQ